MKWWKILLLVLTAKIVILFLVVLFLAQKPIPEKITYGMSFNVMYANELGLDWKETYDAIIDELGVRHLRLAAHWPMVEPKNGEYNFTELDYQITRAEEVGAEVILAVGRRLPRWPECHVPEWAKTISETDRRKEQLDYFTAVIERYKNSPAIKIWQVENEPFLTVFAFEHCGDHDVDLLEEEIALAKGLDGSRPVLVTDSGNLGLWYGAYSRGDLFGTSVYVHFWNPDIGQFRTWLPPFIYRVKENVLGLIYGKKETLLIELSAEPWLIAPITTVPLATQFSRMDVVKFDDILNYAKDTRFEKQYLWGAEWWYWLHKEGYSEMWDKGKELYPDSK
jgi:hypothetical protein